MNNIVVHRRLQAKKRINSYQFRFLAKNIWQRFYISLQLSCELLIEFTLLRCLENRDHLMSTQKRHLVHLKLNVLWHMKKCVIQTIKIFCGILQKLKKYYNSWQLLGFSKCNILQSIIFLYRVDLVVTNVLIMLHISSVTNIETWR